MKSFRTTAVVIGLGEVNKPQLEDAIQAVRLVECILKINDDATIEPGHLAGISLMLANAEKVLAEKRSLLPSMSHGRRRPTAGSTAWPVSGHASLLMN